MKITIRVNDDSGTLLAKRDAASWELAQESLTKLQKYLEGVPQDPEIEQVEEKEELLAQEELDHEQI